MPEETLALLQQQAATLLAQLDARQESLTVAEVLAVRDDTESLAACLTGLQHHAEQATAVATVAEERLVAVETTLQQLLRDAEQTLTALQSYHA